MSVECWDTNIDILVVTPFYIVSNLYKRKYGTVIAPLPIELVKGSFKQLGKRYIWQVISEKLIYLSYFFTKMLNYLINLSFIYYYYYCF